MKKARYNCIAAAALLLSFSSGAEELPPAEPKGPPGHLVPPPPESGRKFRSGPGIWQAFSRLEPEERKKMQQLQREDPVKFREEMRARAEELFRKRQMRMAELNDLAKRCRESENADEKAELRKRLTAEVEKDFRAHLAANRRQLAETKRRAARLERELNRREANCSRAVAAQVEAMISGSTPPDFRRTERKMLEK